MIGNSEKGSAINIGYEKYKHNICHLGIRVEVKGRILHGPASGCID